MMKHNPFIFRLVKLTGTTCLFTVLFFLCHARSQEIIDIGRFSTVKSGEILPSGWKPLFFRN
ncbi:MAG: hypothetical protein Q8M56_11295, partial [Desulfobacterales bacterium]|nr:hypothetical protein [Desulfobacterales bacterium]